MLLHRIPCARLATNFTRRGRAHGHQGAGHARAGVVVVSARPETHGVLVTYRRAVALREHLAALAHQPAPLTTLTVIDNDADPMIKDLVEGDAGQAAARCVRYVPSPGNPGPAGGFRLGIEQVLAGPVDDDDIVVYVVVAVFVVVPYWKRDRIGVDFHAQYPIARDRVPEQTKRVHLLFLLLLLLLLLLVLCIRVCMCVCVYISFVCVVYVVTKDTHTHNET